ncbi:MAG: SPOR domain-containing protein [Sulfurovum sp.]
MSNNNNDHNLDDLIIDSDEPTNNKAKSFLTIVALSIVVLIVAIILTKTLLKNAENEALNFEQNYTENIAPELKLETGSELDKIDDKLSLSNIIAKETTPSKDDKDSISKDTIDIDEDRPKSTKIKINNDGPAVYVPPVKHVKKVAIPKSVYTQPVRQPKRNTPPPEEEENGRFYIKVGAYSKTPSSRFLSVIRNSGFRYIITRPSSSGIKKLLIGPYNSRNSANNALYKVQDRITKQAYVVEQ